MVKNSQYTSTSKQQRDQLIQLAIKDKVLSIRKAASQVGIKYSNAKKICTKYKLMTHLAKQGFNPQKLQNLSLEHLYSYTLASNSITQSESFNQQAGSLYDKVSRSIECQGEDLMKFQQKSTIFSSPQMTRCSSDEVQDDFQRPSFFLGAPYIHKQVQSKPL